MPQTPTSNDQLVDQLWLLRVLGWLLIMQALFLFGKGLFYLLNHFSVLSSQPVITVILQLALWPFAALSLFAAISFLRAWLIAWPLAMMAQGLILATTLIGYLYDNSDYFLMISGLLLVLYLNYADGQANLQDRSIKAEEKGLS